MGTSTAVMTARQHGKSILGSKVTHVWLDEWDTNDNSKAEKPKQYLEFTTPPLAIVVAMQEAGKSGVEIYETLDRVGKQSDSTTKINIEHQTKAAEIYNYFAKKHTMRRLKNEFISEWMSTVDELCNEKKRINKDHLPILVSLLRIYNQNKELESVVKLYNSVPKANKLIIDHELEFIKRVELKYSGNRLKYDYYWKTNKNHLVRIRNIDNEMGKGAWDLLSTFKKIKIKCKECSRVRVTGYDFYIIQPSKNYEVNIA